MRSGTLGARLLGLVAASTLWPTASEATYSPPLTRVRIDADRVTHSPELVLAMDRRDEGVFLADARVLGGQYLLQLEWASGFGLQVGAALAQASVDVTVGPTTFEGQGTMFLGGQVRGYAMVWSSPASGRAHALTAFVNVRAAHYFAPDGHLSSTVVSGGVGAMAELVLGQYLSVCPYAWLTPGLYSAYAFRADGPSGPIERDKAVGPGLHTAAGRPGRVALSAGQRQRGARVAVGDRVADRHQRAGEPQRLGCGGLDVLRAGLRGERGRADEDARPTRRRGWWWRPTSGRRASARG